VSIIAARLNRIKPSPSSMASQRVRELRAAGCDIIGLTSGEPDFDTPSFATSMQTLEEGCHRLRLACEALR